MHAARLGSDLVLTARTSRTLESVASDARNAGADVEIIAGDLEDGSVCRRVVEVAQERFGRIDALVNNAAILDPLARIANAEPDEWAKHFQINLVAPVYLTRLALPALRESLGRVVNVSSGAAVKAVAGWAAYCASKAALNRVTSVLAAEEPEITAIALRPGMVDTSMQDDVRERGRGVMDDDYHRGFVRAKDEGQLNSPDEIGRAVAVLALYAQRGWSGEFMEYDDPRVAKLVASNTVGG
jgi:NAD(P)-dependent dehydrogenase (short-subunit alcohol dehydrogenase family)